MFNLNHLDKPIIKIILAILTIIEIVLITNYYAVNFTDYVLIVTVVLAIPIAYYLYAWLVAAKRIGHEAVRTYEAVVRGDSALATRSMTNQAVQKLIESQAYQNYRRKLVQKSQYEEKTKDLFDVVQLTEDEEYVQDQIQRVVDELQRKEQQIFDH